MYAIIPIDYIINLHKHNNMIEDEIYVTIFISYDKELTENVLDYLNKNCKNPIFRDITNSMLMLSNISDDNMSEIINGNNLPSLYQLINIDENVLKNKFAIFMNINKISNDFIYIEGVANSCGTVQNNVEYHNRSFNNNVLNMIRNNFNYNII
jgi:hypothetical protein